MKRESIANGTSPLCTAVFIVGVMIPLAALWSFFTDVLPSALKSDPVPTYTHSSKSSVRDLAKSPVSSPSLTKPQVFAATIDSTAKKAASSSKAKKNKKAKAQKTTLAKRPTQRGTSPKKKTQTPEEDPNELRETLLAEAKNLATHSDNPVASFLAVALAQKQLGYIRESDQTFEKALDFVDYYGRAEDNANSQLAIVKAMITADLLDRALDISYRIQVPEVASKARAEVSVALAKVYKGDKAKTLALSVDNNRVLDNALARIAVVEVSQGDTQQAESTLSLVKNPQVQGKGLRLSSQKLADRKDFDNASRFIQRISDNTEKDLALTALAERKAKHGDAQGGMASSRMISDSRKQDVSLRKIADTLAKRQAVDDAHTAALSITNEKERSKAIISVAQKLASKGEISSALDTAEYISRSDEKDQALRQIAIGTARSSDSHDARSIANRITDITEKDKALSAIAESTQTKGDFKEAVKTVRSMNTPTEKSIAYAKVARREAREGREDIAFDMLREAQYSTPHIYEEKELDQVNSNFALAYAETSYPETALELAQDVQQNAQRDRVLGQLAAGFARKQRFDLADTSANSIFSEKHRNNTRKRIVREYAKQVPAESALESVNAIASAAERVDFLVSIASRN